MNLRDIAESISVEHNNFIDKKYNLYNNLLFKNYFTDCDNFIEKKEIGYLNFETITKKSCFYKPPETNNLDFINNIQDTKNINFNINTRAKTSN
jgi:hypothetical protein